MNDLGVKREKKKKEKKKEKKRKEKFFFRTFFDFLALNAFCLLWRNQRRHERFSSLEPFSNESLTRVHTRQVRWSSSAVAMAKKGRKLLLPLIFRVMGGIWSTAATEERKEREEEEGFRLVEVKGAARG